MSSFRHLLLKFLDTRRTRQRKRRVRRDVGTTLVGQAGIKHPIVVYRSLGNSHGTDRLSRNFGTQLPTYVLWHPRRKQASVTPLRKPEVSLNPGMMIEAGSCQFPGFEGDTVMLPKIFVYDASRRRLAVNELTRRSKSSDLILQVVFLLKQ